MTVATSARPSRGFSHESSVNESVEWYTPPEIFEALDFVFDLDPCSPGEGLSYVPARRHYTAADDGLSLPWEGTVFMNPPYGPHTKVWMRRLAEHGDGIALVFARTDVKWFQEFGTKADLVCFVDGRIRFFQGDKEKRGGSPGAGSMLLAFGETASHVLLQSGLGACYRLVEPARS